jgi:L-asparaginase/Glu-tRNA(Gln) amidotransferase subunit D
LISAVDTLPKRHTPAHTKALRIQPVCLQDISTADRRNLADRLAHAAEEHILVTHGTDTMIETAQFVAEDRRLAGKRIVFVGSFKPECFKESDAAFNVGVAIGGLQVCACALARRRQHRPRRPAVV